MNNDSKLIRNLEKELENRLNGDASETPYKQRPNLSRKDEVKKQINFSYISDDKENANTCNSQSRSDVNNKISHNKTPCRPRRVKPDNDQPSNIDAHAMNLNNQIFSSEIKNLVENRKTLQPL